MIEQLTKLPPTSSYETDNQDQGIFSKPKPGSPASSYETMKTDMYFEQKRTNLLVLLDTPQG